MLNDQSLNVFLGSLIAVLAWTKVKNLADNPGWQQQILDFFTPYTQPIKVSSESSYYEEALAQYHQAHADANRIADVDTAGAALAAIAELHLSRGQVFEAQRELESSLQSLDPNSKGGLRALRALARARLLSGQEERALVVLLKSLEMVRTSRGSQETEAILLSELGEAQQSRGNLQKAQEYLEQALTVQEQAPAGYEQALTYTRLGRTLHRLGNAQEALAFHKKALQIQEAVGNFGVMAEMYCDLARAQRDSNADNSVAIASVEMAEHLLQGTESSIQYGNVASLKADLLRADGQLVEAEAYAKKAIQILQGALGARETPQVASALNSLGRILLAQRRFSDAVEHHRQALVIDLKTHGLFHTGTALSYSGLGEAYKHLGNGGAAKHCFEKRAEIELRLK